MTNPLINQTGAVEVMSAGNDSSNIINTIPAGCTNIHAIIVESTQPNGNLSSFSNHYNPNNTSDKEPYKQYAALLNQELGSSYPQSTIVRAPC